MLMATDVILSSVVVIIPTTDVTVTIGWYKHSVCRGTISVLMMDNPLYNYVKFYKVLVNNPFTTSKGNLVSSKRKLMYELPQ